MSNCKCRQCDVLTTGCEVFPIQYGANSYDLTRLVAPESSFIQNGETNEREVVAYHSPEMQQFQNIEMIDRYRLLAEDDWGRSGYYSEFCISNYCFGVYAGRIFILILLLIIAYVLLARFAPEVAESIRKKLASQYRIWQKLTGGRSTGSDKNRHSKSANRRGSKQTRKDKSRDQGSDDDDKKKDSKKRKGKTSNGKDNKKTQQSDKSKSKKDNNSTDEDDEDRKKEPHKTRKDEKPNTKEKKKAPKSDERSKDNISVASRASLGRRSSSRSNRQTNVERRPSTTSQKSRERARNYG
ncbi:hypothetical protein J6590_094579 [Homalodisca vitripennis]|nr:hypothetical protein J6590_094579 [Homalodisca vitripennis]